MHCPNDNTLLQMTSREGIEIDYCPTCRGVWLDRGELDKLIERGNALPPAAGQYHDNSQAQPYRRDDDDDDDYDDRRREHRPYDGDRKHDDRHQQHGHHKKKEGFLGDLFDF